MVLNESTIPDLLSGPVNIKWEEGAPAPVDSEFHTAVLYNGVIYVGGGVCVGGGVRDDCENLFKINVYHPDTNQWDDGINAPHVAFAMTVLMDKLIIVGGAVRGSANLKATNKLLTLQGSQWKDYSQMPTGRLWASAVSHQSMMIVMGGMDDGHTLSATELLDSTTGQWVKCNDLPQPLASLQSAIIGGMLYTLGGSNNDGGSKAVYAAPLDTLSNHQLEWQQLADTPWSYSTTVSVNNKYLLALGGEAVHCTVCILKRENDCSVITSASWESIGALPKVHKSTSAVSLGNQIIAVGGGDGKGQHHKTVTIGTFQ